MTINADSTGKITGKFIVPANVPAGAKRVDFMGLPSGGSRGFATFTGQGSLVVNVLQDVTSYTTTHWWVNVDPLAQTFTLDKDAQIAGIDLWFTACGGNVRVQVRTTQNGFPTATVVGDVTLPQAHVVTNGNHTRALFPAPVSLKAAEEYAFIILCDDATTACAIAEVGKFDTVAQTWVTSQPYTVGTLLSSSNASSWTAHHDKDLTFRILEADFTTTTREINMGTIPLTKTTDMMLCSIAENPSAATRVEYELTLPAGESLCVASGQVTRFAEPVSGNMTVKAKLSGTAKASPVFWPGTQLIAGTLAESADYYTRSIPASGATKAVLIYDAIIPSGANVTTRIKKDDGSWVALTSDGSTQQGEGLVEYRFKSVLSNVNLVKVKLTLTGTSTARPRVRNIRLLAVI
ncbi:MAG: hypothetical protein RRY29_09885 [Desulfovibrionaceae bacterium]